MMRIQKLALLLIGAFFILHLFYQTGLAAPKEDIEHRARCPVCGMFVAKYPAWITQIHHVDGSVKLFDGVKDMMVYYHNTKKYGGGDKDTIKEMWVKDYYTLKWINGRKAFYVIGSDVYGPMGREFIPFDTKKAAESFRKDHHGKQIVIFDEITKTLVDSMLSGM